jgi:hypothetical protein
MDSDPEHRLRAGKSAAALPQGAKDKDLRAPALPAHSKNVSDDVG